MRQFSSPKLGVTDVPLASIRPNPRNARRHSAKQIAKLAAAIAEFGFNVPIVIDEGGMILCGHARYEAAVKLRMPSAPCIQVSHLTEAQKTGFAIADNQLGDLSTFDDEKLKAEIEYLIALDFNVELTGLDTAQIDILLDPEMVTVASDPADSCAEVDLTQPAVSRPGDLWGMGPHRLMCGDALQQESYETLLGADRAAMVFTDPPYNVPIARHVSGLGKVRHREFAMASGEMSDEQFSAFLSAALGLMAMFSIDGSLHFVCMDWRHLETLLRVGGTVYAKLQNLCVWVKTNAGMGSLYRSQHEMIPVFKKGTAPHRNNIQLGKHGRWRTNAWVYAGANAFGATRDSDLEAHPTVKPLAMVADAIRDCTRRGDIVLDGFAGSGTIILAAERTGRKAAALELDPLYVDTAVRRWQALTGKSAILAGDGRTFHQVQMERAAPSTSEEA